MVYDLVQPAAFVPNPHAGPFYAPHYTLTFPTTWRGPVLDLFKYGKPDHVQGKIKHVPIKRLNALMRAVAPDLIAVDSRTSFAPDVPWLYASGEYPQAVMDSLIHAWLRDLQPSAEAYPLFRETVRKLDTRSLRWELLSVDMLQQTVSTGGTSLPADHLYRLLTETLAARIAQLPPFVHQGTQVTFRQVAGDARANGAELMSWPPLEYKTKTRDGGMRTWYYCGVIRVALRTVPFSPIPRIHISTGIRRWVTGPVWMPSKGGVSAYILADNSLVPDGPEPARFAVAKLAWDYKVRKTGWAEGSPEGMLLRVSALGNLPAPDVLAKEPETWLPGRDGIVVGVAHHTMMGRHGVGTGLMPSERRRLVEWAAQALQPEFVPIGQLRRTSVRRQNPSRILERNLPVPKKATDEDRTELAERNAEIDLRNAETRRARVAAALDTRTLVAFLLYQTDAARDHLIAAAEASLGLSAHRVQTGPRIWSWRAPDGLSVRIHAVPLGEFGAPLGEDQAPRKGRELDKAIAERRAKVNAFLSQLSQEVSEAARVTFVELDGKKGFAKRRTDPKFAIRLGCADAGMVSQFLRPPDQDVDDEDDNLAFRATAAWADGLRQLGMRLIPEHTLGDAIPEQLNQVAFWLVKRRVDGPTNYAQFTPVAVLIRPGEDRVMGRSAEMREWVPYPELLKSLTGKIRPADLKTAEQQATAVAIFIKNTLYALRGVPTLVVTHAQNTRYRWPWLQNSGLVPDRIQIGGTQLQRIALHGKHLRIARIATNDRDETPDWWAPNVAGGGGLTKGLWVPADADDTNRVFYGTTEKSSTHLVSVEAAKLTPHQTSTGKNELRPGKNAWNPGLLEIVMVGLQPGEGAEHAEKWAMYLHQQRFCDDYRDGLGLPLILHLAELTSDYALPHEEADKADPGDEPDEDVDQSDLEMNDGTDV